MKPIQILPLALAAGVLVPIAANADFDVLIRDLLNTSVDNQINNTTEAETILALGAPAGSYDFVDSTDNPTVIDYGNSAGSYSPQNPFPNPIDGNDDYAIRATANIIIPVGDWTIGFASDDGGTLRIPGITFLTEVGTQNDPALGDDEVRWQGTRGHAWTFGTFTVGGAPLSTTIEAIQFERGGGDSFEVAFFAGHATGFDVNTWDLLENTVNGWTVQTAPLITDTDGDGLDDDWEDTNFGDGVAPATPADLAHQDGTGDPDGDGLDNLGEQAAGSDPNNDDSDGDTLSDGDEVNTYGTFPTSDDSDGDLVKDGVEVAAGYDPTDADSDADGLDDGVEDANQNGAVDAGETDAKNPDTDGDTYQDGYEANNPPFDPLVDDGPNNYDGDSLDNATEAALGTDPLADDSDGDGDNDDEEVNGSVNPYTGGVLGATPGDPTDPTSPDSDGDGVIDGDETDNSNGSVTDPNNTDTDGDGVTDDVEISLLTDPTDPLDLPAIIPPAASLTWDAAEDRDGDQYWPTVEFPASTVMRWDFGAPSSPIIGETNFGGVLAWHPSPSATMESFNDSEFNTNFNQPTNKPVTYELVFRPGDLTGSHLLFETGGNGDGLGIVINGDTLEFRAQDANSDAQRIILSHIFTAGDEANFHHIVGTIQTGATGVNMGVLYVNGTQVDTVGATGNVNDWAGGDNSGLGQLVGSTPTGQTGFAAFTGDVARLRFWDNTILSSDEVGALYDVISAPAADNDADGLPDSYEVIYFGSISAQSGTDDGDGDGLDNVEELAKFTNPTLADTDGDGDSDGEELGGLVNPYTGGVFGPTPGDPTDPLDADSDDDGLSDGEETDNANGSVSDPNNADTDGDGYPDSIEVSEGTDPTDPGDKPNITLVTSLGTGTAALLGGDITDPENDGDETAGPNHPSWNWDTISSTDEPGFDGEEFSYNIFDNQVGGGAAKWCCNTPDADGHQVTVTFKAPYNLTHFTVTSGNDTPGRDPVIWSIQGSNDGVSWTDIYPAPGTTDDPSGGTPGLSLWSARNEVLRFDLSVPSAAYTQFRYNVTEVAGGAGFTHQLNEIELFGTIDNTDTDGGGLPDWFETLYGLDINNAADDTGDADGDGLSAAEELAACTDPTNSDTDGDGLTDAEEVNATTGFATSPIHADSDTDGVNDGDEIAAGTDPLDPLSFPIVPFLATIVAVDVVNGTATIEWSSIDNATATYDIYASETLVGVYTDPGSDWTEVAAFVPSEGATTDFVESQIGGGGDSETMPNPMPQKRFYLIVEFP